MAHRQMYSLRHEAADGIVRMYETGYFDLGWCQNMANRLGGVGFIPPVADPIVAWSIYLNAC